MFSSMSSANAGSTGASSSTLDGSTAPVKAAIRSGVPMGAGGHSRALFYPRPTGASVAGHDKIGPPVGRASGAAREFANVLLGAIEQGREECDGDTSTCGGSDISDGRRRKFSP